MKKLSILIVFLMFIGTISCADDVYAARSNKETILNITVGKSFTEKKTYKGIVKVKNSSAVKKYSASKKTIKSKKTRIGRKIYKFKILKKKHSYKKRNITKTTIKNNTSYVTKQHINTRSVDYYAVLPKIKRYKYIKRQILYYPYPIDVGETASTSKTVNAPENGTCIKRFVESLNIHNKENSYITIKKTKSRIYVTYSEGHNYDHLGINERITSNDSNSTYAKYTERTKGHGTNSISIKCVYKKVK